MLTISPSKVLRHRLNIAITAVLLTFGCSTSSLATPSETLESTVKDCRFLGKVEGSSGYGKNMGWQPLAKSSALQRAEKLEASHVVWERLIPVGAFNGYAIARAYSCNS